MAVTRIKRIPPIPIALAVGSMQAILGFFFGLLSVSRLGALQKFLTDYAGLTGTTIPSLPGVGTMYLLAYPLGGFIVGFLGTLIVAYVYNLIAQRAPVYVELK